MRSAPGHVAGCFLHGEGSRFDAIGPTALVTNLQPARADFPSLDLTSQPLDLSSQLLDLSSQLLDLTSKHHAPAAKHRNE